MKVVMALIVGLLLVVVTMLFYTETKLLYSQSTKSHNGALEESD